MDAKQFRRHLRKESTNGEKVLWFYLRSRKFLNLKMPRQHTIENFTVDFYCDELKLIIEVDGGVHRNLGQANYDHFRDQLLKSRGYNILRIDNASVVDNTDVTMEWLQEQIERIKVKDF